MYVINTVHVRYKTICYDEEYFGEGSYSVITLFTYQQPIHYYFNDELADMQKDLLFV